MKGVLVGSGGSVGRGVGEGRSVAVTDKVLVAVGVERSMVLEGSGVEVGGSVRVAEGTTATGTCVGRESPPGGAFTKEMAAPTPRRHTSAPTPTSRAINQAGIGGWLTLSRIGCAPYLCNA